MADAARTMGADDRAARLPVGAAADELADLAAAFNGLLGRLAEAFARERRFTGEASHQLRTPVAAMIGQVEVALRRDREPAEYRQVLEKVLAQAGRLWRVVDALLFLARSQTDGPPLALEPLDLAAVVRDRLAVWADHPRAGDLRLEAIDGVFVSVHRELLGELVDAVLDNALKYSDAGTPVTVGVGRDAEHAWVEVEDRGVGIAEADAPHLFQPFFRATAVRDRGVAGVGLGLAVAARIATAFGGTIRAHGELDGTRFRVALPCLKDERGANAGSAAVTRPVAGSSCDIGPRNGHLQLPPQADR
jgi:signal transduction histidine kinase